MNSVANSVLHLALYDSVLPCLQNRPPDRGQLALWAYLLFFVLALQHAF